MTFVKPMAVSRRLSSVQENLGVHLKTRKPFSYPCEDVSSPVPLDYTTCVDPPIHAPEA